MTETKQNTNFLLAVLLGPIYLLLGKEDKDAKFIALQVTFLWVASIVVNIVISILRLWMLSNLVSLAALVGWIALLLKALKGEAMELPVIGEIARKYV